MGKVITEFTISLDGFIAEANDDVGRLLRWYFSGDTEFPRPNAGMNFKVSRASAEMLTDAWSKIGVIVTGRRDFDVSNAWGGKLPVGEHAFIVTHSPPQEWIEKESPFTFVTEGVARAIELAKEAAGEKNIALSGTKIVQQCLLAGLVDEIQIDLVPILLGEGIRLFDNLGANSIDLEIVEVTEGTGVTHLRYRVIK